MGCHLHIQTQLLKIHCLAHCPVQSGEKCKRIYISAIGRMRGPERSRTESMQASGITLSAHAGVQIATEQTQPLVQRRRIPAVGPVTRVLSGWVVVSMANGNARWTRRQPKLPVPVSQLLVNSYAEFSSYPGKRELLTFVRTSASSLSISSPRYVFHREILVLHIIPI